jgi:hypothetical protein
MRLTFAQFKESIEREAFTCAATADSMTVAAEPEKSSKFIAAAALAIHDKGATWCIQHPKAFQSEVIKYLGWAVRIALMFSGGGTFVVIARVLLPIIIEVLHRQFSVCGVSSVANDFARMETEARRVLKG